MSDAINLRDLKFRWHRDKPWTLDIPHFEVRRGDKVFIQGPSGSGKTTLLNLIGGIVLADEGQISYPFSTREAVAVARHLDLDNVPLGEATLLQVVPEALLQTLLLTKYTTDPRVWDSISHISAESPVSPATRAPAPGSQEAMCQTVWPESAQVSASQYR